VHAVNENKLNKERERMRKQTDIFRISGALTDWHVAARSDVDRKTVKQFCQSGRQRAIGS
jgi:hypothetical protein